MCKEIGEPEKKWTRGSYLPADFKCAYLPADFKCA